MRYPPRRRMYKRQANPSGPKKVWVPKCMIVHLADVFDITKKKLVMVLEQWMLVTHNGRKVYVPRPPS